MEITRHEITKITAIFSDVSSQARECLQPGETCDALLLFTREGWTCNRLMTAAQAEQRECQGGWMGL